MDLIKIAKVEDVALALSSFPFPLKNGKTESVAQTSGTIHLTPHHLIFKPALDQEEVWLPFTLFQTCTLHPITSAALSPLVIRTRTFKAYTLFFKDYVAAIDVWESCKAVIQRMTIESTYAFCQPSTSQSAITAHMWSIYQPEREFARQGAIAKAATTGAPPSRSNAWRWSTVNADYEFCATYPAKLAVPAKISDVTLRYGKSYRSKQRIPVLVYLHWANLSSITRSSQPMAGLLNNTRSIQDEKLIEAVFHSHNSHTSSINQPLPQSGAVYGARCANLIIDARPTTNARANAVKGAGSENMDYYKDCKKEYLGIDNIHVMRDALKSLTDTLIAAETTGVVDTYALRRSGWLKHLSTILEGALIIVKNIHVANSHVLIHCSDGWDRTGQLSALSQLSLDPYYRTIEGFAVLIEKEFVSFGHKFNQRTGHTVPDRTVFVLVPGLETTPQAAFLSTVQKGLAFSSAAFKETSPVFHQFLDCVYQLMRQFPARFEFDQRLLQSLLHHLYACEYGNFLFDCEQEVVGQQTRTKSVWSVYLTESREPIDKWRNPLYDPSLDDPNARGPTADQGVLIFNAKDVVYWFELFGRKSEEMNDSEISAIASGSEVEKATVEDGSEDPISSLGLANEITSSKTDGPRKDELLDYSPSGSWSPSKISRDLSTSAPLLPPAAQAQIQNVATSVWKFGGSSWKSLKQGYSRFQQEMNSSGDSELDRHAGSKEAGDELRIYNESGEAQLSDRWQTAQKDDGNRAGMPLPSLPTGGHGAPNPWR